MSKFVKLNQKLVVNLKLYRKEIVRNDFAAGYVLIYIKYLKDK